MKPEHSKSAFSDVSNPSSGLNSRESSPKRLDPNRYVKSSGLPFPPLNRGDLEIKRWAFFYSRSQGLSNQVVCIESEVPGGVRNFQLICVWVKEKGEDQCAMFLRMGRESGRGVSLNFFGVKSVRERVVKGVTVYVVKKKIWRASERGEISGLLKMIRMEREMGR
ncbi:putative receptor protein kinase ZmPK1-like protein [Corchorus olitorius]|uniref:Receptor protein kinase ZmPK1-like protein n=1 Tax=Corchorus olitorius TaxID=93759 RepID=A0A1R3GGZ7_9ROSI|nr:putative receptor protein kinase ZmPK1-like protein [Corchorus olitorius]